jgi:hypothetical protein
MTNEKVLYTDGHEVTVTESFFQVKKTMYQLKGIIHHDFLVIHPHRFPSLIAMLVGAIVVLLALLNWLPINSLPTIHFLPFEIDGKELAIITGSSITIMGTVVLSLTKERYAIRLATAVGERNVLISKRREYITQILDALNRAFMNIVTPNKDLGNRKGGRTFMVGSR